MNEKSNFYVFEKKEVFLIILFVILVAITSFLFGLKLGSSYSFDQDNSGKDLQAITTKAPTVDFKSSEEETVEKTVAENTAEKTERGDINKKIQDSLKQKLVEEFSNANKKFNDTEKVAPVAKNEVAKAAVETAVVEPVEEAPAAKEPTDDFSGKYTIVIGSFESLVEGKEFADGFKVLGYSPIINEVDVPGKGNRFRVSLGIFENILSAKEYVVKNKSLFSERDYFFYKFD